MPRKVLKVLVVDDSAYVRKLAREMLSRSPFLEVVGTASNGEDALEQVERLRPDVVTCDLLMPHVDGVEFVRAQMARRPLPIVIVSAVAGQERAVMRALDAGAIDFVHKPTGLATERLGAIAGELIEKVKAAGKADAARLVLAEAAAPRIPAVVPRGGRMDVVAIGVSTGGPQALRQLLPRLPTACPAALAIALHMPSGFTEFYARSLDELSGVPVREAKDGDEVRAGTVLLAPGGRHLGFERLPAGRVVARVTAEPASLHRPSVDVLFRSAAEVFGERVLGVVLTGMGSDGRDGAAWIKAKGGVVLTEAAETCVVYGMPRSVVEAGLSDASVPLDRMPAAILERL
jgi:two-component system chemotaxis response regulator CheB